MDTLTPLNTPTPPLLSAVARRPSLAVSANRSTGQQGGLVLRTACLRLLTVPKAAFIEDAVLV